MRSSKPLPRLRLQPVIQPNLQAAREPDARYLLPPTLVDSCVLIDVLANDPNWAEWSLEKLDLLGQQAPLEIGRASGRERVLMPV